MATNKIETFLDALDDVFWFPEIINTLTKAGIQDPIYRVLELFKSDPICSLQIQRYLESAIGKILKDPNEKAKWKPKIESIRAMPSNELIILEVLGDVRCVREDGECYPHQPVLRTGMFTSEELAAKAVYTMTGKTFEQCLQLIKSNGNLGYNLRMSRQTCNTYI